MQAAGQRNYRHLGDLTGASHENVRRYLRGISSPSVEFLSAFCAALGINGDWLLTGKGPMLRTDVKAESLRGADPGELLSAMAGMIEKLDRRVEMMERWIQDLETRVRAYSRLGRQGECGGESGSAGDVKAKACDGEPSEAAVVVRATTSTPPKRVQLIARSVAKRRNSSAD